jgi:hypothetical protein
MNLMSTAGFYFLVLGYIFSPVHFLHGLEFQFEPTGKSNRVEIALETNFAGGAIRGSFSRIRGNINFEVEKPTNSKGLIHLDSRSLHFGHFKVAGDAHSREWLDSHAFPEISFILHGLSNPRWNERVLLATGFGQLRIKEKFVNFSIPLSFRYYRNQRRKIDGIQGDLVVLKGQSSVSRNQLGLHSGFMMDQVMDRVDITINLVGASDLVRPFLPSDLFR